MGTFETIGRLLMIQLVGRQASRERTTGGTRVNGNIARGCGQHTELWGLPLAASFLWSSLCGDSIGDRSAASPRARD